MSVRQETLADVTDLLTDGTHYTPPNIGKGVPFLTVRDISEAGIDFENCSRISEEEFESARKQNSVPKPGDVLFSKDGTVGKVHLVREQRNFAVLSSLAILRPSQRVAPEYLAQFLRSPSALDAATKKKTGSAIRRIVLRDLATLQIPLPHLDEQKRIAAILDKADQLRQKRRQAIALLDSLTQSIFLEMFGHPANNPKGWSFGQIGDLLESVNYGTSGKAGAHGEFPILRMGNVTSDGRIDIAHLKYIDLTEKERAKYTVKRGDLLFNRTNSADLVGKTAVFDLDGEFAFAGYLVRARANQKATTEFVSAYLNSSHGKKVLRAMAKSIVGMANINAKEMQRIAIFIPPVDVQVRFSEKVDQLRRTRQKFLPVMQRADSLFSSLQHRAFSGQL